MNARKNTMPSPRYKVGIFDGRAFTSRRNREIKEMGRPWSRFGIRSNLLRIAERDGAIRRQVY
jgi:hypothetical protein